MTGGQLAIQPADKYLKQLFLDDFWEVPDFQREYVWRANREVHTLIEDLIQAYREDLPDYFLGSVVYYPQSDGTRALVDGQQRMTTLLLLIAAMRDRMKEPLPAMQKAIRDIDASGDTDEERFRIALQYSEVTAVLEKLCSGKREELSPGRGGPRYYLVNAYDQCIGQLSKEFGDEAEDDLRNFWKYLWMSAHVVTIQTPDLKAAYKIFETLNDRGKALNASDLLRNYLFRSSGSGKATMKALHGQWKQLTELLRESGENTQVRFLRYFLMSTYGLSLDEVADKLEQSEEKEKPKWRSRVEIIRADGLFDWILLNEHLLQAAAKPEEFAKQLTDAAADYANFMVGRDTKGKTLPALQNIVFQRTGVRQHLCLLLAGRHLTPDLFSALAEAIESLTLCYAVADVPWNTLEKRLPAWSSKIRQIAKRADLDRFIGDEVAPEITSHGNKFWDQMDRIYAVSPSLAKYTLARLTAYAQSAAVTGGSMSALMEPKVTVEHVLPRSIKDPARAKEDNWRDFGAGSREEAEAYVERLGNLCLVGWGTNSQLSDNTYSSRPKDAPARYQVKRDQLAHVPWMLTHAIATKTGPAPRGGAKPSSGKDKFIAKYGMAPPAATWNAAEVERRHEYLRAMIRDVWPLLAPPPVVAPASRLTAPTGAVASSLTTLDLIGDGESDTLEFKASFRWSYDENRDNKKLVEPLVHATAAFMNTNGGTILVGVGDSGEVIGLAPDFELQRGGADGLERHYRGALTKAMGAKSAAAARVAFLNVDDKTICRIQVPPSPTPVWLKNTDSGRETAEFRIRLGGSSQVLDAKQAYEYIAERW